MLFVLSLIPVDCAQWEPEENLSGCDDLLAAFKANASIEAVRYNQLRLPDELVGSEMV